MSDDHEAQRIKARRLIQAIEELRQFLNEAMVTEATYGEATSVDASMAIYGNDVKYIVDREGLRRLLDLDARVWALVEELNLTQPPGPRSLATGRRSESLEEDVHVTDTGITVYDWFAPEENKVELFVGPSWSIDMETLRAKAVAILDAAGYLGLRVDVANLTITRGNQLTDPLTASEWRLFYLLYEAGADGRTRDEFAEDGMNPKSIDKCKKRLNDALEAVDDLPLGAAWSSRRDVRNDPLRRAQIHVE